tara:strand:+ start:737 stop:1570 length:834 start_codon:yes stop_codon:yes gene_type:complete
MNLNPIILFFAILFVHSNCIKGQRIITAGSSSTEIVCKLGFCDNIVATDKTSKYPSKVQTLPSIGYRSSITAEGIISLNPDIIIVEKGYVKDILVEQLRSTKRQLIVIDNQSNYENTLERIKIIAAVLDKKNEGINLIKNLEEQSLILKERLTKNSQRPSILCVYARGMGNMSIAGRNTGFMIIELAGAKNAVPEIEGYKPLNSEALIAANPDYILFFESGLQSLGGIESVLKLPGVSQTTAGRNRQILSIDGVKLTNWGPRLIETAIEIFDLTHSD